jgi:rare lipoprotein A
MKMMLCHLIKPSMGSFTVRVTALVFAAFFCIALLSCTRGAHHVEKLPSLPKHVEVPSEIAVEPTMRPYEIFGVRYYPIPDSEGFVEHGILSWYGGKFHGRPTASGEIYDMYKKSAAHKTLPMGTWVKVVNLINGKEIVVRINDRGPFVKDRILDLSYASAKELDLLGPGVARGKVIALAPQVVADSSTSDSPVVDVSSFHKGLFSVQVGAFSNRDSAFGLADRLKILFDDVSVSSHVVGEGGVVHRVRVSRSETLSQAENIGRRLAAMGFNDAFVVRL